MKKELLKKPLSEDIKFELQMAISLLEQRLMGHERVLHNITCADASYWAKEVRAIKEAIELIKELIGT